MCTAVSYQTRHHYFGRNLDLERGYGEEVVITPRNFPFRFRLGRESLHHYALIGMAAVADGYPLYFEATNEKGLSMAGLNFPGNAFYAECAEGKENLAPFELIPCLLGECATVAEVRARLEKVNIANIPFSKGFPLSPLHWMISDREESAVLESTKDGMKLWENRFGVLTNNPPFPFHYANVSNYLGLHEGLAENRICTNLPLENYSLGLGAMHLPGDFSSASRFIKAVFVKEKSVCGQEESESVNQFFHILRSVAMPKGCVLTGNGEYEYTRYSCCCNTDTQTYYYTTYQNQTPRAVEMRNVDLERERLFRYARED